MKKIYLALHPDKVGTSAFTSAVLFNIRMFECSNVRLFCIGLFVAYCLLPTANSFSQTPIPSGNVYGTWALAGSPYQIQGNIQIPNDSTLTIQPGVTVEFQGTYKLLVMGRLLAIGTVTDTITFTAANTTNGFRGIDFDNTTSNNDTSKFFYCKIQYGKATGPSPDYEGGAFYFNFFSKAIIYNCTISNCSANSEGGGISCDNSNPSITNNAIVYNTATNGGGISCYISSPTISNNTISTNVANSGGSGGGIFCNSSSYPIIESNTIANNTASKGGGINCSVSGPTIRNNTISNNTATSSSEGGGGIYCTSNFNPTITNNTISNNSAVNGGALYCTSNADPSLRNNILWGNTASTSGAQVFLNDDQSDPNFYYCDVQGGTVAFGLNSNFYSGTYQNNIDTDPLFVSPSGGSGTGFDGVNANWSLQNTSPCIDTGDPNPFAFNPSTDKAGNPRVTVCIIDIGAYEYQNGIPFSVTVSQTAQILCNGYITGALQATVISGTIPYTYLWSPGGQTTSAISNLAAGNYILTVNDAVGCTRGFAITITQPSGMTLNISKTNIDCSGNCIGSATVIPSGGTTPYTYLWSSGETTSATNNNLCSGPYTATVTDAGGCSKTASVTITTPSALSFSTTQVNVSCFGGNNGSIAVNATGGTSPYQYSKNGGGNYQSSNNFAGLTAGTNSVVVKDNNGCQTSITVVTITEPLVLSLTTSQTTVDCYTSNNATATAIVSGGTTPYTYLWTPTAAVTATATGLTPGIYSVSVTDSKGCTAAASVSIVSSISNPSICTVTVDSLSQYNLIVWDKTPFSGGTVDTFLIYRDTANNAYGIIGKVPYDSLSQFIDTARTLYAANGNPNVSTWRYKLAAKDTCGNLSALSPYHQSLYIQNSGGNFSWNHYEIQGQPTPVPALDNYLFQRDTLSKGNWATIQTLSASSLAYTDLQYATYQSTGSWRVITAWNISCTPSTKNPIPMSTVKTSKSNTFKITGPVAVNEASFENEVSIYPNPFAETATLQITNGNELGITDMKLFDVFGREQKADFIRLSRLGRDNAAGFVIRRSNLVAGVYYLKLVLSEAEGVVAGRGAGNYREAVKKIIISY